MKKLLFIATLILTFFIAGCGGVDSESSGNNAVTITGYVIDDPVVGATIEVYDENGNLIAKKENATDKDGKYLLNINKNISKYLIVATNGKVNGTPFNDTLYSICFNDSCNVTPITTIIALEFNKNLKIVTQQNIQNFSQNVLGIDNYQSINTDEIKKIRELAKLQGVDIDYIAGVVANDLTDGYADNNLTTQIFPNVKIRQTIQKQFEIDTADIDNYQNRNLKILNLRTGEKVDINQSITYKDYGLNVALVEDYNYTLYDGTEENASTIIYLPFKPYSDTKLDINSSVYYYIFLDPNLASIPDTSKKDLINIINTKYKNEIDSLKATYKNYINYGDIYKTQLMSQIDFLQTELVKNELTQYNISTNNTQTSKIIAKMINTPTKITYNKNYVNFGCISIIHDENNKTKIYNILPVYLGFTTKYDFQTMENDGYYNIISGKSIFDSFNHKLIDENPGGFVGFAISKLFSLGINTSGKPTPISFDKNENTYVIYKSYHLTSLSSILNYLDIVSKLIHISLNNEAIQKSIKSLQTGEKIYSYSLKTFDLISTGLTLADSLISLDDILTDEELLKAFNIPYDKDTLEKLKFGNEIKENVANLNKFTTEIQNLIKQFNIILPEPKSFKDVALDEVNMTKMLENFIDKVTKRKYSNIKLFIELNKIPTYDGKLHPLLISAAILSFYVEDKNYKNYYDKFIKNYPDKSNQSAYFNTDKLSVAMYIIFNAMKAKKENDKKLDNYAIELYKKGILIVPGKYAQKDINRNDIYMATLNTLKYFYNLNRTNKRNIFDYIENLQNSLGQTLSNIREKINIIKSSANFVVGLSKELSKKDISTVIWEYFVKPTIEKSIESGEDIIKEKIINLLTANPYATLIQLGNEAAGKITSFVFFPNKITFKVKTDANSNVYISSAITNITPIAFEKGIVEPEMTRMQYAFLKKPTNNSYYGVIVANKEDPSWYRPYFETIFKESAEKVRRELDEFDTKTFVKVNWNYEYCSSDSIDDKFSINESLCQVFGITSYNISGDDIDNGKGGDWFGNTFIYPYPDKNGDITKNGSYFDFFDYIAKNFDGKSFSSEWGIVAKNGDLKVENNERGIYIDKISAKYFAFDDDSDSKFSSPEASDVLFKIASAKDFDYDVEVNNTAIKVTNLSTSDYPVDLTFLIIKTSDFAKETPPSMVYSFSIPYSFDQSQMTKVIPISNISMLGDKITIIAVDSILNDYAKFIGIDNLMQVIYSLKDQRFNTMKEFFDIYSSQQAAYPFMKVKNINITPDNPPFIDDWNINTSDLTATLSVNVTDPDGDELTCSVDWGDGSSDNFNCDENISHTYSNYGDYNITLTAEDTQGLKDSVNIQVSLNNTITYQPPTQYTLFPGHYLGMTPNMDAFAALRKDGKVVTWGNSVDGGDSSSVADELHDVVAIYSAFDAFAALRKDGTVVTWGNSSYGGDSSSVADELHDVVAIYSTGSAFAALRKDGTVVTWDNSGAGGNSSSVEDELHDVVAIYSTYDAFAALRKDGTVVTWGDSYWGGDSSSVADELHDVVGFSPSYIWQPQPLYMDDSPGEADGNSDSGMIIIDNQGSAGDDVE